MITPRVLLAQSSTVTVVTTAGFSAKSVRVGITMHVKVCKKEAQTHLFVFLVMMITFYRFSWWYSVLETFPTITTLRCQPGYITSFS